MLERLSTTKMSDKLKAGLCVCEYSLMVERAAGSMTLLCSQSLMGSLLSVPRGAFSQQPSALYSKVEPGAVK